MTLVVSELLQYENTKIEVVDKYEYLGYHLRIEKHNESCELYSLPTGQRLASPIIYLKVTFQQISNGKISTNECCQFRHKVQKQ